MEELLKLIVSEFINSEPAVINDFSVILLPGSILVHRMFSAISEAVNVNLSVKDYMGLSTFGEIKNLINQKKAADIAYAEGRKPEGETDIISADDDLTKLYEIGIDMEHINNLPRTDDFREEKFYKENFTPKEITYSILQPEPYQTLAGKFAAKEAIIKTGKVKNISRLNDIEILNDVNGKPYFKNFYISLSHTNEYAVAAALWIKDPAEKPADKNNPEEIKELRTSVDKLTKQLYSYSNKYKIYFYTSFFLLIVMISLLFWILFT